MIAYSSLWGLVNHGLLHRWLYTRLWCFCSALGLGFVEGQICFLTQTFTGVVVLAVRVSHRRSSRTGTV